MAKYVYSFDEGKKEMKNLLGGKGANLSEMTHIGVPVPPGFTVTTEMCTKYYADGKKIDASVEAEIFENLAKVEEKLGKKFGDVSNPLLLSVRSGARISMPGMMDTVLNLGLNQEAVEGFAKLTNNERLAYDSYRRFIQMFSDVVLEISKSKFEAILDEAKEKHGVESDTDLTAENLKEMIPAYLAVVKEETGKDFPQDPKAQLMEAVEAVFRSWNNPRAIVYRNLNEIPHDIGTAVNVQAMVFGNAGETSGTGVAFTRNPATGDNGIFGEFLMNAQGEDVVAGIRTPLHIEDMKRINEEVYNQFMEIANKLENHYRDMQDLEFTIENGTLYFLQTRTGKRTAAAAVKIAVEMVEEGLITKEEAIMRIEPKQLDQLLHPTFDKEDLAKAEVLTTGLPASPGAASGKVYFTSEDAKNAAEAGEKVILVRAETSPEDIEGMVSAEGILTQRGGMTSHAAVVARGMGTCCVAGCGSAKVDEEKKVMIVGDKEVKEGEFISLNGNTGDVYTGSIKTVTPELSGNFGTLMGWADETRTLKVRTNADTPRDAAQAVEFGAEGIGLCRTEHMFFEEERIFNFRQMIVSDTVEGREKALEKLFPYQKEDFVGIYKAMEDRPVTVRLLDPPLHEFLPHKDEEIQEVADALNLSFDELKAKVEELSEFNPMLGHRGCRLGVTYPEIYAMQVRAIITAAVEVNKGGLNVVPEIMIPLVGHKNELAEMKALAAKEADAIIEAAGVKLDYKIGTMIEIPRAAVTANQVAEEAEFFSFGTNDLTQMTFGFSRDDAGKFISEYKERGIFEKDPFQAIDQVGVGSLMKTAVKLGQETRPDIKLGICGEHGGEPSSIEFCHRIGLNYVSCSPFRVPIARLAAAQAAIINK
ncbi:MAG: pyruvate, phosphate dikinase [Tissierellales bacterium]|jgi:pyruvate,orthophosphate dikinase|nr:pyruvate, phosphate dikinase [Tissierellales bacterium]